MLFRSLKKVSEGVYDVMKKRLEDEIAELDESISQYRQELSGIAQKQQWIDWLGAFGKEVDRPDKLSDQAKQDYLQGLIKRIDVRCKEADRAHELTIHLQIPIIRDGIKYTGKKVNGRKEYEVIDGSDHDTLTVQKKDRRGWH